MSYLPGDVLASLSSLSDSLAALEAPLTRLAAASDACVPTLEAAKTELALAYAQYVLSYVCQRADGEDSADIKDSVLLVKECADGIQAAIRHTQPQTF